MSQIHNKNELLKGINPSKVYIPTLIGLGVVVYMILTDDELSYKTLGAYISQASVFWLAMAVVALLVRDLFYIYRIRHLTRGQLSWTGSMYTIFLWEFSSAVSPSAVGGTAVASFLLLKEGISFGKSLAYVLVSAVLDNMFFILVGAVVITISFTGGYPQGSIFPTLSESTTAVEAVFFTSYTVITLYTILMAYGLFVKPEFIKWLFIKLTSFRWLKRFQHAAEEQGNELVIASAELKGIHIGYWIRAILSTLVVWVARYFIVNCLISAVNEISFSDHTFIFSRHVVLWVILLIGFTPGASGIAEIAFKAFFEPFSGTFTSITSIVWRIVTYYPYLILGVIFLPRWINRVFSNQNEEETVTSDPVNQ